MVSRTPDAMRVELHWPRRDAVRNSATPNWREITVAVVFASEVGGRWSEESRDFLRQLAKAKTRSAPRAIRSRLRLVVLQMGHDTILACGGARSFALLERRGGLGVYGPTLTSHDVQWEAQYV